MVCRIFSIAIIKGFPSFVLQKQISSGINDKMNKKQYKTYATTGKPFLLGAMLCITMSVSALNPDSAAASSDLKIEQTASVFFKAFSKIKQVDLPLEISADSALAIQNFYIALLRPTWGLDVGYIARATRSPENEEIVPTGILLENMFTGTRAIVNRSFGVNMHAAGEILFRVRSFDINQATTRAEALRALESVIPAVRLSDMLVSDNQPRSREVDVAANLEIRMCVLGAEIALSSDTNWIERLSGFTLTLYNQEKEPIAVLDETARTVHPLDAVLAIRDALHARAIIIREGEILALGALTKGHPVQELTRLRAVFDGLAESDPVFVYMGFQ